MIQLLTHKDSLTEQIWWMNNSVTYSESHLIHIMVCISISM